MFDPRSYVRPGQPVAIAAAQINWINEQTRKVVTRTDPSKSLSAPYTWVYAKNTTNQTVPRWGVLGIVGVEIEPTGDMSARDTRQFEQMPVLTCETLEVAANSQTGYCVALEPIQSSSVARVAVAGVVQVKAADVGKLPNKTTLWSNDHWALVLLGGGDGGVRICTFTESWPAGTIKTVTLKNSTETLQATNLFYNISADCGSRDCAIANDRGTWYLVAYNCI